MKLAVSENISFEDRRGEFMAAARLEYLQDDKGVYGVSIPILTYHGPKVLTYILRPDRLGGVSQDTMNLPHHMGLPPPIVPYPLFDAALIERKRGLRP